MLSLGCSGTVETTVLSGFLAVADLTRPYRVVDSRPQFADVANALRNNTSFNERDDLRKSH